MLENSASTLFSCLIGDRELLRKSGVKMSENEKKQEGRGILSVPCGTQKHSGGGSGVSAMDPLTVQEEEVLP